MVQRNQDFVANRAKKKGQHNEKVALASISSPFETPDAERDRINALSNISVRFSSDTKQDGLFSRQENGLSGSEMRFRR